MRQSYLFTSESVSEGHPDKVADQISDAVVDLFLSKDPEARVACETLTTTNLVVLAGEIRGKGIMDEAGNWAAGVEAEIEQVVRETVRRIGYEQEGFHWEKLTFKNHLHPQSAHIAQGVDAAPNLFPNAWGGAVGVGRRFAQLFGQERAFGFEGLGMGLVGIGRAGCGGVGAVVQGLDFGV